MNDAPAQPIEITKDEHGLRLDRWFRLRYPELTHSHLQKLLRTGQIRLDSKRVKSNARVEAGQRVRVPRGIQQEGRRAPSVRPPPGLSKADRNEIERMIIFEDDAVIVLNKPFGLAVQGGTGTRRHIDGLLAGMADRFGGKRPRLVHRLDRDTTGVLLVAKTREAASNLGQVFSSRSASKTYWALVKGVPRPPQGKIEAALVKASGPDGDRIRKSEAGEQDKAMHAATHYSVIETVAQKAAWMSLKPVTGRQHQLRAHMDILGHPIVGDNKYPSDPIFADGEIENILHLHARRLIIPHPLLPTKIDVTAPLPEHMRRTWSTLGLDPDRYDA
jgi:23S rRNA pseudouridine955/2504/2580 synthase